MLMGALKKVIAELHRRSLWQVLGIYIAGAIGALEIVDMLVENAGLPGWFPALALALIILGLPIVLATAFIQEGGPGSDNDRAGTDSAAAHVAAASDVQQTPSSQPRDEGAPGIFTWRNAAIGGAAAVLLWAGIAVGWAMFGREANAADGPAAKAVAAAPSLDRSIAVLPFATRSAAEEDRYFAEGMHDDLLTQLAKIDGLTVISRTSVMQYAETTSSIPEIAAELGVSTILEGAVQRSGERIRVNMQLIEAETDRHLWAETYDEELSAANVFAIQSDLAHKIAAALQATLNPAVAERLDARPTESLEAYDLVARGRYVLETDGTYGMRLDEAIDYFRRATALDATYAAAWAGLADSYLAEMADGPTEEIVANAEAAVQRALALDDDLAEAHLAHSRLLSFIGQTEQALVAVQHAHALEPGSAEVQRRLGVVLEQLGRHDEAVAAARRAVQLDPRTTRNRNTLADRLYFAGAFDESIQHSRRVVEMDPTDWYAYYNMGWAHAAAGRPQEALAAFRHMPEANEDWTAYKYDGIAYAYAIAGQRDSALAALGRGSVSSHDRVLVYYVLGDADTALDELRRLLRERPDLIRQIARDPTAKEMIADPRFAAVIEQTRGGS